MAISVTDDLKPDGPIFGYVTTVLCASFLWFAFLIYGSSAMAQKAKAFEAGCLEQGGQVVEMKGSKLCVAKFVILGEQK